MATTITTNSPKLTANIADHADVHGGRSLVFDGIVDYLTLGNSSIFNHSGNYSISVWIKKIGQPNANVDTNANPTIIAKGNVYFTLFVNFDGMLGTFFYNNSNATDYNIKTADGVIKLNVWHHVVLTWNNSSSQLYVDGKQEYSGSYTPYNLNTGVNGTEIRIGDKESPTSDTKWHGNMCDMKIFDSHLTEAQVTELYRKPENTPSAVQDNLVAWYPMCEGNPESPQSIVYDHSEKGLDSEKITNGSFNTDSDWSKGTGWSINATNGTASADGTSGFNYLSQSNIFDDASAIYKMIITIDSAESLVNAGIVKNGTVQSFQNSFGITSVGTHTVYFTNSTSNLLIYSNGVTTTISNISVKKVLMGNYATTNFFGDELFTDGDFEASGTTSWDDHVDSHEVTLAKDTGTVKSGSKSLKITRVSGKGGFAQAVTGLDTSKQYRYTGWVYSNSGNIALAYKNDSQLGLSPTTLETISTTGQWVQFDHTFTPPASTTYIGGWKSVDGSFAFLDDFSLKEVGISSSGFETAVNEPVVPQVPLMRYNQVMYTTGSEFLQITTSDGIDFGSTEFTLSFFVIPLKGGEEWILGGDGTNDSIRLDANGTNRLSLRVGGTTIFFDGLGNIEANKPYFFTITRASNGDINAYMNGVKSNDTRNYTGDYLIKFFGGQAGISSWRGNIIFNEFSIFNTHFSDAQAQELFADSVIKDATTHSKASALRAYWRNDGVTTWKNRADNFVSFDGVNDVITRNAINVDYKSVLFWMRPSTTATTASSSYPVMTFFDWSYSAVAIGSATSVFTNELIMIQENVGGGVKKTAFIPSGGETIPSDSWTHIAFVWNGSNYDIYFNGVKKSVVANTGETNGGHVPLSTNKILRFGHGGASGATFYNGDLTGIAIWSESLTDAQVLSIYNAGQNGNIASIQSSDLELYYTFNPHASTDADTNSSVQDRSGNNRDSTSVSGAVIDKDGTVQPTDGSVDSITIREGLNSNRDGLGFYFTNPSNNVLRLNGVDEYLLVDKTGSFPSGDQSRSITCWIKPHSFPSGIDQPIVFMGTYDGNQMFTVSFLYNSTNRISVWGYNNDYTGSDVLTIDNWWYVGVTYDSGTNTLKSYIGGGANNINPALDINNTSVTDFNTTYGDIKIGRAQNKYFDGMIDEVKIYNRALSADEILKDFKHQKGKHKND